MERNLLQGSRDRKMKIQLIYVPEEQLGTHLNICPTITKNDETDILKCGEVTNLDGFVNDAQAMEIVVNNVLDYISLSDVMNTLDHWIKKLRHGGHLILSGIDAYLIAKAFTEYKISIEEFNILLHGPQNHPLTTKRVNLTVHGLANYLTEKGLYIIRKRIDVYDYVIEAARQ
jgi:hypothetical protein